MAGANELTIFIDANTSGLQQGLQQAENEVRSFQDRIQGIADIGQKLAGLGAVMTAGLTVPIIGLASASVKAYGEIQSLQKGLEAVMGSASLASDEFNKLKEVAKLPGLGMQEAVKGSINLQSIGISAENSRNILQQFGNAVATVGKGRVEFERAIYGVQQLANTDFPLGEDLNIIKEALPQVSNLLKEAFGSSRSDELANMGVSSKQVLDVILTGLEKLPRVSGGIKGEFENLSDAMQTSLGRIGKVIDDNLNISGLIDKLTSAVDSVITAFEGLNPTLQKIILAVGGVLSVAGPLLLAVGGFMAVLPTLTAGVTALGGVFTALTGPVGLVTLAIVGVVTAVVANWDKIRPYIEKTIDQFKRLYNESFILRTGINTIVGIFQTLWYTVKNLAIGIYEQFKDVGKFVLNVLSSIGDALEGVFTLDASKIKASIQNFFSASDTFAKDSKNNLINTFSNIGNELTSAIGKTALFRFDTSKATDLSFGEKEITKKVKNSTVNGVKKGIEEATKSIDVAEIEPVKLKNAGFIDAFGNEYKSFIDFMTAENKRLAQVMSSTPNIIDESLVAIELEALRLSELKKRLNEDFNNLISSSVSNSISEIFNSIGESLAQGGNLMQNVGKTILKSLGGFLSKMGQMLIQYGTLAIIKGKLDLATMIGGPTAIATGIAAVAVGAALSLAGGAISSFAGSGGNSNTSSSTCSSASTNYSSSYSNTGVGSGGEVILRLSGTDLIGAINRNVISADRLTSN